MSPPRPNSGRRSCRVERERCGAGIHLDAKAGARGAARTGTVGGSMIRIHPDPSPFVRGTTDTTHFFFVQSGSRRPIPDNDTLNFLLAGQSVRVLSNADLAAIPLGAALPFPKRRHPDDAEIHRATTGATYYLMTGNAAKFRISRLCCCLRQPAADGGLRRSRGNS